MMLNRIFSIIGWLGTALVLGRGRHPVRSCRRGISTRPIWRGPASSACSLYIASQWREIVGFFSSRQAATARSPRRACSSSLGILVAVNYIGKRQNKRWDLTATKQFSLSDQSRNVLRSWTRRCTSGLRPGAEVPALPRSAEGVPVRLEAGQDRVHRSRQEADASRSRTRSSSTARSSSTTRAAPSGSPPNTEQDITNGIIKVVTGQQKKVYFTQGHGERTPTSSRTRRLQHHRTALGRENYARRQARARPDGHGARRCVGSGRRGPARPISFRPEIDALKKYLAKNGKLLLMLDPPAKPDSPPLTNLIALAHDWGMDVGNNVVVDASGMGRLIRRRTRRCRSPPTIRRIRSPNASA